MFVSFVLFAVCAFCFFCMFSFDLGDRQINVEGSNNVGVDKQIVGYANQ